MIDIRWLYVEKRGIGFRYCGDDLLYVWPWLRNKGWKYISWGTGSTFRSLKEVREFWSSLKPNPKGVGQRCSREDGYL